MYWWNGMSPEKRKFAPKKRAKKLVNTLVEPGHKTVYIGPDRRGSTSGRRATDKKSVFFQEQAVTRSGGWFSERRVGPADRRKKKK